MSKLKIKRIYEQASKDDGIRILVDRLWPRGIKKADARIDYWLKDIAPNNVLRKWFNHNPNKWKEFCHQYYQDLVSKKEIINTITQELAKGDVTLIYAAKDEQFNNAQALKEYMQHYDPMNGMPSSQAE